MELVGALVWKYCGSSARRPLPAITHLEQQCLGIISVFDLPGKDRTLFFFCFSATVHPPSYI